MRSLTREEADRLVTSGALIEQDGATIIRSLVNPSLTEEVEVQPDGVVILDEDGNPVLPDAPLVTGLTDAELRATPVPISGTVTTTQTCYALRYDEGATYTYIAEAVPGSATGSAVWRIKRLTNADNTIGWADGVSTFTKIYDNRASFTYT